MKAVGESPIDPGNGDQADVQITASLKDVRNAGDLTDYTGELRAVLRLRITDRYSGEPLDSVSHDDRHAPRRSTSTARDCRARGRLCNVATTADAVMTDLVREGKRAIWRLGQVQVFDGGADGDADTAGDNTLFAVQGLFTP